jgi:Ni/Co efflux regulator RcnB
MRTRFWVIAAIAMLGSGILMAQEQNNRPNDRSARPDSGGRPAGRPDAEPNRPAPARPPSSGPRPGPGPRPPGVGPRPPHRFMSEGHWHHGVHGPGFHYPPGFRYRRWSTGLILPPIFLSAPYYYDNYAPLGLGPPPPGYRWVRYGPDLLLVNIVTGRIADVVDGVFY